MSSSESVAPPLPSAREPSGAMYQLIRPFALRKHERVLPEGVEQRLVVEHDGDDHAVRDALGDGAVRHAVGRVGRRVRKKPRAPSAVTISSLNRINARRASSGSASVG